ncbi:hypothetical protein AB0H86_26540 [Streptomyces sp. NPDC050997]|uniref:hypothetical protein n=1 Tax=Streptomyces sp. NPDC050997 TaxID=3155519 RepID=UPI00343F9478
MRPYSRKCGCFIPEDCTGEPTFADNRSTADADLAVNGLLLDFKSTRRPPAGCLSAPLGS